MIIRTIWVFLFVVFLIITLIYILGGGYGTLLIKSKHEPLVFAHRGSPYFPENSKQAITDAYNLGFNALEVDINLTKDNKIILFHDETLTRLLKIEKYLSDVNFQEIEELGLIHADTITNIKLAHIDEVVVELDKFEMVYLDVKISSWTMADKILRFINKNQLYHKILIADSNLVFLSYLKFKNPHIQTVLEGFKSGKEWIYYVIPKDFKPDYYASFIKDVDNDHLKFLKNNNLLERKIVYGVDKKNYKNALDLGIKNIILDYDESININQMINHHNQD
jgi:glycerophosphoryl diester phosphodiesterase